MPEVKGEVNGQLDIKRCYLPGLEVHDQCPDCKKIASWVGGRDYISYPTIGSPINFSLYCEDCDKQWYVKGSIEITINL